MSPGITDTITRDRFKSWAHVLKGRTATPFICVAVGHGAHQGEIHVVSVEDVSDDVLLGFLRGAVAELERKLEKKGGAS